MIRLWDVEKGVELIILTYGQYSRAFPGFVDEQC